MVKINSVDFIRTKSFNQSFFKLVIQKNKSLTKACILVRLSVYLFTAYGLPWQLPCVPLQQFARWFSDLPRNGANWSG